MSRIICIQEAHKDPFLRESDLDLATRFPALRRSREPFAVAQGLHTEYSYPQQFLVTLRGDPVIRNDWIVAPCMVRGNTSARQAINHVLHAVANRHVNPRSLCNHVGCICNQGDLLSRRRRFQAAINEINDILCHPDGEPPSPPSRPLLVTHATCPDVVLDSGATRHVHNKAKDFRSKTRCSPQTLAGFTGEEVTIDTCGRVGNFHNVLHVPTSQASVRSVGAALDLRGGRIIFTATQAQYVNPQGKAATIAHRTNYGLYSIIPGSMPPPASSVPIFISVPMQIRREAIHRLHKCLGHAGLARANASCDQELSRNLWVSEHS